VSAGTSASLVKLLVIPDVLPHRIRVNPRSSKLRLYTYEFLILKGIQSYEREVHQFFGCSHDLEAVRIYVSEAQSTSKPESIFIHN